MQLQGSYESQWHAVTPSTDVHLSSCAALAHVIDDRLIAGAGMWLWPSGLSGILAIHSRIAHWLVDLTSDVSARTASSVLAFLIRKQE